MLRHSQYLCAQRVNLEMLPGTHTDLSAISLQEAVEWSYGFEAVCEMLGCSKDADVASLCVMRTFWCLGTVQCFYTCLWPWLRSLPT